MYCFLYKHDHINYSLRKQQPFVTKFTTNAQIHYRDTVGIMHNFLPIDQIAHTAAALL